MVASYPSVTPTVVCASSDAETTDLLLSQPCSPLFPSEPLTWTEAVNYGLHHLGDEDDVVVCNDDIAILTPQWLDVWQEHLDTKRGAVGAIGPISNNVLNMQRIGYRAAEIQALPFISFFCVCLAKEALQAVGGLDERFGNGPFDDLDWSERAKAEDFILLVDRRVWVWHYGSQSMERSPDSQDRAAARALLVKKHPTVEEHLPPT